VRTTAEHPEFDVVVLYELRDLIAALGVFWGRIEVETNEDLVGGEIAEADIMSGHSLLNGVPGSSCGGHKS
jgi:hypothetical protein